MILIAPLFAALLSGCAIVEVRTADKPPELSLWPLGVKVDRGAGDAVTVNQLSAGVAFDCLGVTLGVAKSSCSVIDPTSCGVAIVRPDAFTDMDFLARVSDQTRATCLHQLKGKAP